MEMDSLCYCSPCWKTECIPARVCYQLGSHLRCDILSDLNPIITWECAGVSANIFLFSFDQVMDGVSAFRPKRARTTMTVNENEKNSSMNFVNDRNEIWQ